MPLFEYVGDDERVWPEQGLTLAPGAQVELDENPDPVHFADVVVPAQ